MEYLKTYKIFESKSNLKFTKKEKKKGAKTDTYDVTKSGTVIGQVKCSSRMRGYAFLPTTDCDNEIKEFVKDLMKKRREEKTNEGFLSTKPKLVWIHGLPGSGKTHMANTLNDGSFIILDDVSSISDIKSELEQNNNIILVSPYFDNYLNSLFLGDTKLRNTLNDYDYDVEEIWFENDLQTCIQNLKNRTEHTIDTKHIITDMNDFSKKYKIPDDVKTIPVWSNKKEEH